MVRFRFRFTFRFRFRFRWWVSGAGGAGGCCSVSRWWVGTRTAVVLPWGGPVPGRWGGRHVALTPKL